MKRTSIHISLTSSNPINDEGVYKPNRLIHCDIRPRFLDNVVENPLSVPQPMPRNDLVQQKNVALKYMGRENELKALNVVEAKENMQYNIKIDNFNVERKHTDDNKKLKKEEKDKKTKKKDCNLL